MERTNYGMLDIAATPNGYFSIHPAIHKPETLWYNLPVVLKPLEST